jgi:NAD(P)-dependent dehydrogenase (short-subunit alcohol dehydrogenase family)
MTVALFELTGKTALVTGGAQGIGKAICKAFAEAGARVMVGDIAVEEAARTAAELAAIQPGCAHVALDVASAESAEAALEETLRQFGRLDILVNNAGINTARDRVTIERFSLEEWRRVLSVDLDGVFLVSRPVVRHMQAAGGGRIINIASVLGIVPARLQSAFVAAKAGVVNLTKSMALELAPDGILVNCIAPGSTLTEGTRQLFYGADAAYNEKVQSLLSHIPLARPGETEEIAAAAVFLAAPASSYITGVVLPVDGGWTAGYIRDW